MTTPKKTNKKQTQLTKKSNKSSERPQNVKVTKKQTTAKQQHTAEKLNAETLFEQALLRHKKDLLQDRKEQFKEIGHLALMAQEYLSSFALIGYSLQNERVVVFNMPTPKDEAALVDLLRATFVDIVNNRP